MIKSTPPQRDYTARAEPGLPPGVALLTRPGRSPLPVSFRAPRVGRYVLLLLAALATMFLLGIDDRLFSLEELNVLGPVLLLVICLAAAADLVRRNALLIFSPLFWLFVISAVYYGLGPLIFRYGNPISIFYVNSYYYLDTKTLYRTNLLNVTGLLAIALTFAIGMRLFPLRQSSTSPTFGDQQTVRFILVCLLIGSPIRYILVPLNNSMMLGILLPSQILEFQYLVLFAMMLMIRARACGNRQWNRILIPLLAWELLVRFAGGGKLDIFFLMLPIFLGIYLARPSLGLFFKGALGALVIWSVITRTTDAVRLAQYGGHGSTLSDRVTTALTAFGADSPRYGISNDGDVQRSWTRLCYGPAQGFCLDSYDEDRPGDTFSMWFWSFVPRVLFPQKPELTVGQMFNVAVTGNPNSKAAPGAFAEAYWNGGWLAVYAAGAFIGALFVLLTHLAVRTWLRADYRWLPLVWAGIVMGLRIDDFFVTTYIGSWVIALSTCGVLYLIFPNHQPARRIISPEQ
jgi:hypothetical protein